MRARGGSCWSCDNRALQECRCVDRYAIALPSVIVNQYAYAERSYNCTTSCWLSSDAEDKDFVNPRSRQHSISKSLNGGLSNEAFDNEAAETPDVIMMMDPSHHSLNKTSTAERRASNAFQVSICLRRHIYGYHSSHHPSASYSLRYVCRMFISIFLIHLSKSMYRWWWLELSLSILSRPWFHRPSSHRERERERETRLRSDSLIQYHN